MKRRQIRFSVGELVALEVVLQAETEQAGLSKKDKATLLHCLLKVQRAEARYAIERVKLAEAVASLAEQSVSMTEKRLQEIERG